MINDETSNNALQHFAKTLTTAPSWVHLPSGIAPLAGWQWFIDGDYCVFEPPARGIQPRDMIFLDMQPRTTSIEAVFRTTPHPGVYLQCKLTTEDQP